MPGGGGILASGGRLFEKSAGRQVIVMAGPGGADPLGPLGKTGLVNILMWLTLSILEER